MQGGDVVSRCIARYVVEKLIEEGNFEQLVIGKQLQSDDCCSLETCGKGSVGKSASGLLLDAGELGGAWFWEAIRQWKLNGSSEGGGDKGA